ncbi:MAG: hypothetical protein M3066_06940 [Actinomycetota bacterium]|nr:hypothetical protein [Actinomycetota bacterium]
MIAIPEGEGFHDAWTSLSRADRSRLRRLVRMGRPLADGGEAAVAVAYARFQRSRLWVRLLWLWFVPGLLLALGIASRIHPVVVGAVLALAAQSVYAHRNLSRVERTNAALLGLPPPPGRSGRGSPHHP